MKTKLLLPLLTLAGLLAVPATAQVNYAVSGGTAYVTHSPNASGNIVIASTYNGYPVTSIEVYAFSGCTGLASVTIGNGVTSIGFRAFSSCTSLTNITVAVDNPAYSSMDGVLFNKAQTSLIQFLGGRGGSYVIPNSVTSIEVEAFDQCASLTSVTIPNSVTSMGGGVFGNCTSLTSVMISNGVTTISQAAFAGCTSLTSVTIPNSVISIGIVAFRDCTSLTSVTIPNSVTNIGHGAFYYCTSLTSVTIGNSVSSIESDTFRGCASLTSVTIPNSVTSMGGGVFGNCTSLMNVMVPNSVINIGYEAFYNCTSLTSVTIPNSVTSLGNGAFSGCTGLMNVTMPNSLTNIGDSAFSQCTSLTNFTVAVDNPAYSSLDGILFNKAQTSLIQFPGGRGGSYVIPYTVTRIGDEAFAYCSSLASVTIPNSVTSIEERAFYYCTSLTSVTIPNSLTNIGDSAFSLCTSLTNFSVDAANSVYSSLNGVLFNKAQTTLIQFPGGRGGSYAIPNSVTNIEWFAFYNCTSLTNVTVAVDNPAYSSLDGVLFNKAQTTLITFPPGRGGSYVIPNSVTSIGGAAFYNCTSLTSVTIGNSVTNIDYSPFWSCTSLTNITVAMDNPAYSSINGVWFNKAQTTLIQFPGGRGGSYVVPNSVTYIKASAFVGCANLTSVTIPASLTVIHSHAFYDCASLTNFTFLGNAPYVEQYDYYYYEPIYNVGAGATIYFYFGTTGWRSPIFGLPAVMLGAPAPQVGAGSAGVKPGGFGFTLTGVVHQTIVVEASTDLANWQPIWTNSLSAASTSFVDPQWLNHPRRFYRMRSAQ